MMMTFHQHRQFRFLKEEHVQILTPRRRQRPSTTSETLYNLYQQRLTNPRTPPIEDKRSFSDSTDFVMRKKNKTSPELVILD